MKKIKILCAVVSVLLLMSSCKDETGMYVDQIYTTSQKNAAIKDCLTQSKDSALSHLYTGEGYYTYNDGEYRILFHDIHPAMLDTLANHGMGYLIDSLVVTTNRMAVSCRTNVSDALTQAISGMVYYSYDTLLTGGDYAITNYFKLFKKDMLESSLQSPVSIRMNVYGVNNIWNTLVQRYYEICNVPVSVDVQSYIMDKMLDGIFEEMRVEEYLIRTDPEHQNDNTALLGKF